MSACGQQHAGAVVPTTLPTSSRTESGAPAYTEPSAGDGAPHYDENSAGRRPGEMSPADEKQAGQEANRIEPVLKNLWKQGTGDPASVRSAMLALGYTERRTGSGAKHVGERLEVRPMESRFETDHYVTPAGAQAGLSVGDDACVTAFVQKSNYDAHVNGPYPESGCFQPPFSH